MIQASIDLISGHIKEAMKKGEKKRVSVLRMLLTALKNKKIALGNKNELSSDEATKVVLAEVKKRQDSIEAYKKANRDDLVEQEEYEIKILKNYCPAQISEQEIEEKVRKIISDFSETDSKNFGKIMKRAMLELKGSADGAKVSAVIKKILQ